MALLQNIPSDRELISLIGQADYDYWQSICAEIDARYDMEKIWSDGGKKWTYEYKYRRGGKTLCALYARPGRFGLMIIFGGGEREKAESIKNGLLKQTAAAYDEATTYHDGKWVMFDSGVPAADVLTLLGLKRRPNRK